MKKTCQDRAHVLRIQGEGDDDFDGRFPFNGGCSGKIQIPDGTFTRPHQVCSGLIKDCNSSKNRFVMSKTTATEGQLADELFICAYWSAIQETPHDVSRLVSEFRELKVKGGGILEAVESVVGDGSKKLSQRAKMMVECHLKEYLAIQDEMIESAENVEALAIRVSRKLNVLAAGSGDPMAIKVEKEEREAPKLLKKRGRKFKKELDDSVEALDLPADVVDVSEDDEKETPARTKKVPVTKFNKKARKRARNSEASGSKDAEQTEDEDGAVGEASGEKPEEELYCLCNRVSYEQMVCCDNESCSIEWFHFECVKLKKKPPGKWYCPKCRGRKSNVMKKDIEAMINKYKQY